MINNLFDVNFATFQSVDFDNFANFGNSVVNSANSAFFSFFASLQNFADKISWENLVQIFSPYLIAPIAAYLVAEFLKMIIIAIKHHRFRIREIFKSGGMPSSHTSTVVALAIIIGLENGFGSPIFAMAFIFATIVITDATHVRRAVGEQGEVLRKLIDRDHKQEGEISEIGRKTDSGDNLTRAKLAKPYLARGHKSIEVIVGGLIGVAIGVVAACLGV